MTNPFVFLANVPLEVVKQLPKDIETGIYFGWANVDNGDVHKMVMSIGWNPFYENKEKSMVRKCSRQTFDLLILETNSTNSI